MLIETAERNELIFGYFERMLKTTFGIPHYVRILDALGDVDNGYCGVETSYFTFPAILMAAGVVPSRSYAEEYGIPRCDGASAATQSQRQVIVDALQRAGIKLVIPPWFNKDLTPNNAYFSKKR
ncbi:MAG: hypothetical protein BroJett025_09560 [Patescibacteria group bacterium]|nr:MAG: hypothetical protein BroJett025_09560 [Patescibacteria group bacterium]